MGYHLALASDFEDEVVLPVTEHAALYSEGVWR